MVFSTIGRGAYINHLVNVLQLRGMDIPRQLRTPMMKLQLQASMAVYETSLFLGLSGIRRPFSHQSPHHRARKHFFPTVGVCVFLSLSLQISYDRVKFLAVLSAS